MMPIGAACYEPNVIDKNGLREASKSHCPLANVFSFPGGVEGALPNARILKKLYKLPKLGRRGGEVWVMSVRNIFRKVFPNNADLASCITLSAK